MLVRFCSRLRRLRAGSSGSQEAGADKDRTTKDGPGCCGGSLKQATHIHWNSELSQKSFTSWIKRSNQRSSTIHMRHADARTSEAIQRCIWRLSKATWKWCVCWSVLVLPWKYLARLGSESPVVFRSLSLSNGNSWSKHDQTGAEWQSSNRLDPHGTPAFIAKDTGMTPIFFAIQEGHVEITRFLFLGTRSFGCYPIHSPSMLKGLPPLVLGNNFLYRASFVRTLR